MSVRRGGRTRVKMGRPAKPSEEVRRNRVVLMLTDAELAKLNRLADAEQLPNATLAYQFFSGALSRRK